MNLGARDIGFRSDRDYRESRKLVNKAKESPRYQQDVAEIRRNNPGIRQRDIDRVLVQLAREKKAGHHKNNRSKSPGSAVQLWNQLTGRAGGKDWSAY